MIHHIKCLSALPIRMRVFISNSKHGISTQRESTDGNVELSLNRKEGIVQFDV